MLYYIIYYIYPDRFSYFSNIYVMFSTYGKNGRWHYLLFIYFFIFLFFFFFALHAYSRQGNSNFLVVLSARCIYTCVIWKMIENFDHDHIRKDSISFFDHKKNYIK